MRLEVFQALAASYGADLERWPAAMRAEAEYLAATSAAARHALDEAHLVDAALDAARVEPDEPAAALARLRAGVASRIAVTPQQRSVDPGHRLARIAADAVAALSRQLGRGDLGWIGMATGSGCAVVAGLMIGAALAPMPAAEDMLALLQPPLPIQALAR